MQAALYASVDSIWQTHLHTCDPLPYNPI